MAWGLEARVPFLDKAFLDLAMSIAPHEKMFGKGDKQEVDEDGCPRMEKVCIRGGYAGRLRRLSFCSPKRPLTKVGLVYTAQGFRCETRIRHEAVPPEVHPLAPKGAVQ